MQFTCFSVLNKATEKEIEFLKYEANIPLPQDTTCWKFSRDCYNEVWLYQTAETYKRFTAFFTLLCIQCVTDFEENMIMNIIYISICMFPCIYYQTKFRKWSASYSIVPE